MDIRSNRMAIKWSRAELMGRLIWEYFGMWLFFCTPRQFWRLRCALLTLFGAEIGKNVQIYPTVLITIPWNLNVGDNCAIGDRAILYNLGQLKIGADVTISQGAHLCGGTHDYNDPSMPLVKSPITIEAGAWVCADAFIAPGITVGAFSVVGARCVATHDVPPRAVIAGNPARVIKVRSL